MTQRLRVAIADDELLARKRLTRLLGAMEDVELCGECASGEEVLERVKGGGVDVLLLDIQMPGLTGLDAMQMMPADGPYVIFCTAHADHAVKAFDAGAVDYLLKPIEPQRLKKALDRARSRDVRNRFRAEADRARSGKNEAVFQRLPVSTRQGIVLVDPRSITHASLDGELVTLVTTQAEYLTDFTLQELLDKLPAGAFERVHRRAIVNLEHVSRLEPVETGGFIARTSRGHAVEVSRQSARELRKRLGLRKAPEDDGT
jgi:two-component system, LytTR family, response regulator